MRSLIFGGAAAGLIVCVVPAVAEKALETPSANACFKAIDAIGARMGEAEALGGETPALRFLVRSNGLDYDVVCDPATGVVKDVARRLEPEPDTAAEAQPN